MGSQGSLDDGWGQAVLGGQETQAGRVEGLGSHLTEEVGGVRIVVAKVPGSPGMPEPR